MITFNDNPVLWLAFFVVWLVIFAFYAKNWGEFLQQARMASNANPFVAFLYLFVSYPSAKFMNFVYHKINSIEDSNPPLRKKLQRLVVILDDKPGIDGVIHLRHIQKRLIEAGREQELLNPLDIRAIERAQSYKKS